MFTEQFEKYDLPVFENGVRMPEIQISKEQKDKLELKLDCSNLTYLKKVTWVKLKEKLNAGIIKQSEKECIERLKFEFSVFEKTGTIDYILLLMDIFLWCDDNNIVRGPGRGSACGALTLYILGLTKVNPLDHNLNFTRFLSEARTKPKFIDGIMYGDGKAMADFDGDIEYYGRDKCIKRLEEKYKGKTSKILTLQYLTGKMALKDTIKSFLEYSESEALEISSEIEVLFGKVASLKDTLKDNKKISSWAKDNMDAFSIAQKIEGLLRTSGVHASGMLISYYNLEEIIPSELSANNEIISGYDMSDVLQVSVKADILGLRTLTQLEECCKLANVKIEEINVNDPSIYEYYLKDSKCFYGLFQIEEGSTKEATLKIKPRNIKHLSAVVAISRPGAIKYIDSFAKFVETGEKTLIHPNIDKVLEETGGIILYQEQITEICKSVYGLPEVQADQVRYAIGKKARDKIAEWEPVLFQKGEDRGIPRKATEWFWSTCNASADYLFNLSHCLDVNTLVETESGFKKMRDIKCGEKIKGFNVLSQKNEFSKVLNIFENEKELYEIELMDGKKIKSSLDHKFMCADFQMRKLKEIIDKNLEIISE